LSKHSIDYKTTSLARPGDTRRLALSNLATDPSSSYVAVFLSTQPELYVIFWHIDVRRDHLSCKVSQKPAVWQQESRFFRASSRVSIICPQTPTILCLQGFSQSPKNNSHGESSSESADPQSHLICPREHLSTSTSEMPGLHLDYQGMLQKHCPKMFLLDVNLQHVNID
jgi:hypothetical protein